jgi:hypothetical protein
MKALRKFLVFLALAWACVAPCYVFLRSNGDDNVARGLQALAGSRLGASVQDMTNDLIMIPKGSVEYVANLARAEQKKDDMFLVITIVSSFVIIISCVVSMERRERNRNANAA